MSVTHDDSPKNQRDLIEYRFDEVFKRLDRMESKMDAFAFAKQADLDSFKKEVGETFKSYITKGDFDPYRRFIVGLIALILMGVGGAILRQVLK